MVGIAAASIAAASAAAPFGGVLCDLLADSGGSEGPRWFVTVSPGSIRVGSVDLAKGQRRGERSLVVHGHRIAEQRSADELDLLHATAFAGGLTAEAPVPRGEGVSRVITEWSPASRTNMTRRLMTLDYNSLVAKGQLAMMTLTYPGDWLCVVPNGRVFKRHVDLLRQRFRKRFGVPLSGVWKMEFQDRGAPHLHMLIPLPCSVVQYRKWVRSAWASIVDHPDAVERMKHEGQGVNVDLPPRPMTDPKRIGVYFSKHGVWGSKEYQNKPPPEWVSAAAQGESVGRFWGYWKLAVVEKPVMVTGSEAVAVSRMLRKWAAAGNRAVILSDGMPLPVSGDHLRIPVREALVWRKQHRVEIEIGEVVFTRFRKRKVRRRIKRLPVTAGFIAVNDGPSAALAVARLMTGEVVTRSDFNPWQIVTVR